MVIYLVLRCASRFRRPFLRYVTVDLRTRSLFTCSSNQKARFARVISQGYFTDHFVSNFFTSGLPFSRVCLRLDGFTAGQWFYVHLPLLFSRYSVWPSVFLVRRSTGMDVFSLHVG